MRDGFLWRAYENEDGDSFTLQLVVPSKYRQQIAQELHCGATGGHLGVDKTCTQQIERMIILARLLERCTLVL